MSPFLSSCLTYPEDFVALPIQGLTQTNPYSCGFATACMVVDYFGVLATRQSVLEAVGTTTDGTSQTGLINGLRKLGISCGPRYRMGLESYQKSIDAGKPVILYNYVHDHWELLYGYGVNGVDWLLVADSGHWDRNKRLWSKYREYYKGYGIVCSKRK